MSETRKVFGRPETLVDLPTPYCPGCGHGVILRLLVECIDELGIGGKAIGVTSIGCSVRCWRHLTYDMCQAAHGRAPSVATGIKRALPEQVVFTYQGDGDLAAIGTSEIVHAAARGEKLTVLFVNNALYGMTGGQQAPTTMLGQVTTTTPTGRDPAHSGYPIRIAELLAGLDGTAYSTRVAITNPAHIGRARRATKEALETQLAGKGFAIVEYLSACPSGLHMTPVDAVRWVQEQMTQYYPLGRFK